MAGAADVTKNLVLLTRRYPHGVAGAKGTRLYVEPSEPIPIERWDYRESAAVEDTLALGARDAERYAAMLTDWLDGPSVQSPAFRAS